MKSKYRPVKLVNNRLVRHKDGDLVYLHEVIESADRNSATVRKVKNADPDGNEASEYVCIECSDFQLFITASELADLQKRYDSQPQDPAPAKAKAKTTRKPKAKKKAAK